VGGGWWVVGGWGEIEIKAKLSPAKAGAWAELGNKLAAACQTAVIEAVLTVWLVAAKPNNLMEAVLISSLAPLVPPVTRSVGRLQQDLKLVWDIVKVLCVSLAQLLLATKLYCPFSNPIETALETPVPGTGRWAPTRSF
jgi:hypothetical protein